MIGRDLRVAWAIAVLDLRRWLAMVTANFRRRDPGKRQPRRRGGMGLWLLLLTPALLLQSALLAIALLAAVERSVDQRMVLDLRSYEATRLGGKPGELPEPKHLLRLRNQLERDPWLRSQPAAERNAHIEAALDRFQAEGQAGFAPRDPIPYILSCPPPAGAQAKAAIGNALALGVGLLLLTAICLRIGLGNRDLGRADDPRAWLRTLPASDRALALARWISGLIDPIAWLILAPVMVAIALRYSGMDALGPTVVQIALLVVTASAVAVAIEELARRHLGTTSRRWVQATGTLVGMTIPVALFAGGALPVLAETVFAAAAWLPTWSGQLLIPVGGQAAWSGALAALVLALLAGGMALAQSRPGRADLVGVLGSRGTRRQAASWTPLSALAKDLLLIRRDPELLLTIVLLPALLVAFNLILNLNLVGAAMADPRHLAVVAVLAGGYAANMAAFRIVPADRPHLWLLWTAPRALGGILAAKSLAIGLVAGGFCVCGLGAGMLARPSPAWIWLAPYALTAVAIHATFVTGLVALMLEPGEAKRPVRQSPLGSIAGLLVLGLLVSGLYAGWWSAGVALALVAAGAVAVWQRASENLRWLMDPGALPPPRLDALAGIGAALAFVVLQLPVALATAGAGLSASASMLIAFISAGLISGLGALAALRLAGVGGILRVCGLLPNDGTRPTLMRSTGHLALGVAAGMAGAVWAVGWLLLAGRLGLEAPEARSGVDGTTLAILAVGVAPVVEELLFRGLILGGLASSLRPAWAIVGSALIFAVIHPPLGFPAVAMLGLACAVLYHQTRWLLAPIACHATYNLLVTLMGR